MLVAQPTDKARIYFLCYSDQLTGRVTFVIELMDISLYEFIKKKKRYSAVRYPEVTKRYIFSRCVSEAKAKYYLYQILKGLQHLHKSGLFHRDVKPENVLMRLPAFHNPVMLHHSSCSRPQFVIFSEGGG